MSLEEFKAKVLKPVVGDAWVVGGRKLPYGTRVRITWIGTTKYGFSARVQTEDSRVEYIDPKHLERVIPGLENGEEPAIGWDKLWSEMEAAVWVPQKGDTVKVLLDGVQTIGKVVWNSDSRVGVKAAKGGTVFADLNCVSALLPNTDPGLWTPCLRPLNQVEPKGRKAPPAPVQAAPIPAPVQAPAPVQINSAPAPVQANSNAAPVLPTPKRALGREWFVWGKLAAYGEPWTSIEFFRAAPGARGAQAFKKGGELFCEVPIEVVESICREL